MLTVDHSAEGYLSMLAVTTGIQFRSHVLRQVVGISGDIFPEMHQELRTGDIILLCSDGFTDMISNREIADIINMHRDEINIGADALIDKANDKGGMDNISAVLVRI